MNRTPRSAIRRAKRQLRANPPSTPSSLMPYMSMMCRGSLDKSVSSGTEAWPSRLLRAGLDISRRRVVVDRLGVERSDDGNVVDDGRGLRQQLADPGAAFPVLRKLEQGRRAWKRFLPGRHSGDPLPHADFGGKLGAVQFLQLRFVIEQVDV